MAVISQSGVDSFMNAANQSANKLASTIETKTKQFSTELGKVWGCPTATEFAEEFKNVMNKISANLRDNMNSFHGNLQSAVNSYNEVNKAETSLAPINYSDPVVDVSAIQSTIPGRGDEMGLVEGTNAQTVTSLLGNCLTDIKAEINSAKARMNDSGAFDMDETAAASDMFEKLGSILDDGIKKLNEDAIAAINETINVYGEVKRSNISRSNQA